MHRIKRQGFSPKCIGFRGYSEQFRDKMIDLGTKIHDQRGFILGRQRIWRGTRGQQPPAMGGRGIVQPLEKYLIQPYQSFTIREVRERQAKTQGVIQHYFAASISFRPRNARSYPATP